MSDNAKQGYDVIIIGGGITGAGTARDCAMRGLRVLLVEKRDFTNGATGRNHGLLHSGARYAVTDGESAAECIKENTILRRIARHCVEPTDGLFITLPEDDLGYQATFIEACHRAGIRAEAIDPADARRMEPAVNPNLTGAVRVPDASIDPFRLTMANIVDARRHGAEVRPYTEVTGFVIENGRCLGVRLRDNHTGEASEVRAPLTINAAGIWGHLVAKMAGLQVNMFPAKGTLLIFGHRVNQMVINRCRKPGNGDILVPDDTVSVIGTTSDRVPFETIDNLDITPAEVDTLLTEGEAMVPALATTRVIRAYTGVRPLVASDNDPSGRSISRGIVLLDHETRDGLAGLITITGGKMMTYRMMAEVATNLACKKLGVDKPCKTATTPLPGSERSAEEVEAADALVRGARHPGHSGLSGFSDRYTREIQIGRHGTATPQISMDTSVDRALVCECEQVSVGEVKYAVDNLHVRHLINLRRRTRVGMGTCQAELCACRAAGVLCRLMGDADESKRDLCDFVQERWKGMEPVAWGDTLAEAQLMMAVYQGLCHLGKNEMSSNQ